MNFLWLLISAMEFIACASVTMGYQSGYAQFFIELLINSQLKFINWSIHNWNLLVDQFTIEIYKLINSQLKFISWSIHNWNLLIDQFTIEIY